MSSKAQYSITSTLLLGVAICVMLAAALAQSMNVYKSLFDAALYFGVAVSPFMNIIMSLIIVCVCLGWFFVYFSGTHKAIIGAAPKEDGVEPGSEPSATWWRWYVAFAVKSVAACNVFANACVVCGSGILGLPLLLHNLAVSGLCYQLLYGFFVVVFFLSGLLNAFCTTFECIVKAGNQIIDACTQWQVSVLGCVATFAAVVTALGSACIAYYSALSMVPDTISFMTYVVAMPYAFHGLLAWTVAVLTFIAAASLYGTFIFEYLGGTQRSEQKAELKWYGYVLPLIATAGQLVVVVHSAANTLSFFTAMSWVCIAMWLVILFVTYGCSFTNQFQKSMSSVITHMPGGAFLGGVFGAKAKRKSTESKMPPLNVGTDEDEARQGETKLVSSSGETKSESYSNVLGMGCDSDELDTKCFARKSHRGSRITSLGTGNIPRAGASRGGASGKQKKEQGGAGGGCSLWPGGGRRLFTHISVSDNSDLTQPTSTPQARNRTLTETKYSLTPGPHSRRVG